MKTTTKTIHILAPGESMSAALAESLRAEHCIAVSAAYQLAPWALALCAQDHVWWRVHAEAMKFEGRKFSTNKIQGVERVTTDFVQRQSSSGMLSLYVAWKAYKAEQIWLHGFNNTGAHYYGKNVEPLTNTTEERFKTSFAPQFAILGAAMKKDGVQIFNATPGSALECFERRTYEGRSDVAAS